VNIIAALISRRERENKGEMRALLFQGKEKECHSVRRFPGYARLSLLQEYYDNEDVRMMKSRGLQSV
jgi:hypothetical protein